MKTTNTSPPSAHEKSCYKNIKSRPASAHPGSGPRQSPGNVELLKEGRLPRDPVPRGCGCLFLGGRREFALETGAPEAAFQAQILNPAASFSPWDVLGPQTPVLALGSLPAPWGGGVGGGTPAPARCAKPGRLRQGGVPHPRPGEVTGAAAPWLANTVEANAVGSEALLCTSDRPHGRHVGQFMGRKWAKRSLQWLSGRLRDRVTGQSSRRLGHQDRATVSLFLLSPAEGSVCQGSTGPWERTIVGEKQDGSPHHQANSPHTG